MIDEIAGQGEGSFEHKLRLRLTSMFWVVVAGLLSLLVAALVWFASDQDERARTMSQRIASSAMDARLDFLSKTIRDYAVWDDAYANIVVKPDPVWMDGNVGPFVFNSLNFERSFLLDDKARTLYAMQDGKVFGAAQPQGRPGPAIEGLVRQAAADAKGAPFARLARIDGLPAMVAVGRVAPSTAGRSADPARVRLLVFVDFLDRSVLDEMSRIYLLPGLKVDAAEPAGGFAAIPLQASNNQPLGALQWQQDKPGRTMLSLMAPIVLGLALLVALIGSRLMKLVHGMVERMLADRRKAEDAIERARLALAAANAAQGDAASARRQLAEIDLAHRQLEDLRRGVWRDERMIA